MEEQQTSLTTITPSFTLDDLDLLHRAAEQAHQTAGDFVRDAALAKAAGIIPSPRLSHEEIMSLVRKAQQEFAAANPSGRNLLEELITARRAAAASE